MSSRQRRTIHCPFNESPPIDISRSVPWTRFRENGKKYENLLKAKRNYSHESSPFAQFQFIKHAGRLRQDSFSWIVCPNDNHKHGYTYWMKFNCWSNCFFFIDPVFYVSKFNEKIHLSLWELLEFIEVEMNRTHIQTTNGLHLTNRTRLNIKWHTIYMWKLNWQMETKYVKNS